jgi:hypothetical protein
MDCEPTLQIGYVRPSYIQLFIHAWLTRHVKWTCLQMQDKLENSSFCCLCTRYPHQFAAAEQAANNIPRSSAPGGENNFMLGWVLWASWLLLAAGHLAMDRPKLEKRIKCVCCSCILLYNKYPCSVPRSHLVRCSRAPYLIPSPCLCVRTKELPISTFWIFVIWILQVLRCPSLSRLELIMVTPWSMEGYENIICGQHLN